MTFLNELIISSGGNKGLAIIGSLDELLKYYPIKNFKYLTGCSMGAFLCFLLNIGYTINELKEILFTMNFEIFQDLKIINIIEKCGFDEGIKFTNFLKAIILNKNFDQNITFKELFDLTGKILTITVTNITKGICEYHNVFTSPDMSLLISLRMTTNIPILFSPILYNNNYYLDGALLDPYPYFYHKNTKKLGLWIFTKYEFDFLNNSDTKFVDNTHNTFSYFIDLLKILYSNYIKKFYKKIPKNTIYIDFNFNHASFNLSKDDRLFLYNIGDKKSKKFFHKIYKQKRKKYLALKYFKIWFNKINKNNK